MEYNKNIDIPIKSNKKGTAQILRLTHKDNNKVAVSILNKGDVKLISNKEIDTIAPYIEEGSERDMFDIAQKLTEPVYRGDEYSYFTQHSELLSNDSRGKRIRLLTKGKEASPEDFMELVDILMKQMKPVTYNLTILNKDMEVIDVKVYSDIINKDLIDRLLYCEDSKSSPHYSVDFDKNHANVYIRD